MATTTSTIISTQPRNDKKLHFLMIPLMCQGHLIPMVDIAILLAKRDHVTVTIVTTPLNHLRFGPIVDRAVKSGLDIRVLSLPFPHAEAGLPEGSENVDTLPSPIYVNKFMHATSLLREPLERRLAEQGHIDPAPNCMVSDKHVAWTADTARRFNMPRILFDGMSCFSLLCFHNLYVSRVYERVVDRFERFSIPGLPGPAIELTKAQLPGQFNPGLDRELNSLRDMARESEEGAFGYLVNSFEELETEYAGEYRKTTCRRMWCVGPVSLCNEDEVDKAERGHAKSSNDKPDQKDQILKWLDSRGPRSVVYACLGSLNRVTPRQIAELGLGLEGSKRPFLWVIRGGYKREEIEAWLDKNGFEERTKGQGLLVRGWAPQVLILSHPSIGVFLTHCGWNSTLEGICAGVPLLTWPLFGEQFLNEKLVVEVLGIGVSVGAQMVVHLGEEESSGGFGDLGLLLVRREKVEEALERVMGDDERESGERRERVKKLAEASNKALVEHGGSSYKNITLLLEDVMQYLNMPQSCNS